MPHDYVYTGFWLKYDEPLYKRWTLTLGNLEAVVVLGCLVTLLACTQARTWVLIRYTTIKITNPIHLPSDLDDLSQGSALESSWHHFRRVLGMSHQGQQDTGPWEYKLSPWFGIWASLNVLVFIAMGVVIPWFLTDGALGAPEVRSQRTDHCLDTLAENIHQVSRDFSNSKVILSDAIWEQCHNANDTHSYCDPNFTAIKEFSTDISADCPFPEQICLNGLPTVTFTRANLTAHDIGINSKVKMTVSQRMSCSPISLRPFVWKGPSIYDQGNFTLSIQDLRYVRDASQVNSNLSLAMWTSNTLGSGLEMFKEGGVFQLQVLPKSDFESSSQTSRQIHSLLKRPNGRTFVIVLKAGATMYPASPGPINDPFFSANTIQSEFNPSTGRIFYFPDREATALGCIEQVQVCLNLKSDNKCYPWSKGLQDSWEALGKLRFSEGAETSWDYIDVFSRNLEYASVHAFLLRRLLLPNPLLLATYRFNSAGIRIIDNIDSMRQWIFELEALFIKTISWQKIKTLNIAQNDIIPENATSPPPWSDISRRSLCDRIIFVDGDYININWIGMCAVVSSLLIICLLSYAIPQIEWVVGALKPLPGMTPYVIDSVSEHAKPYIKGAWKPLFNLGCWVGKRLEKICKVRFINPRRQRNSPNEINLDALPRSLDEEPDDPI
jgi:hypothetical protein